MAGDRPPMAQATSEEAMRAVTIGELQVLGGPVHLAEYDPAWPALFEREAARIRAALGDRVRLLEHVGSTSVPRLAAKPIIDILLAVPDSSDEAAYVEAMEAAGYVLRIREPEWLEHRLFKGPDTSVNVHVFTDGSPEIARMLAFRDCLRNHDDERLLYERAKRELAARDWKYVQHYADAKTEVVEGIIERALAAEMMQAASDPA
ncbi:MAG TPA: GrpB family protein [Candidatus Limnocylindrales bacterium]|nr:GrpB family protein [Candidatus Limnocylindrales bacterium]